MTKYRSMRGLAAIGAVAAIVALGGCENTKNMLGMTKQVPDEFAVVTRAPLELPPDFGLRPPKPGAERPQETNTRDRARQLLLGKRDPGAVSTASAQKNAVASGRYSKGEAALLSRAGALDANPAIRQEVNAETDKLAAGGNGFMDKVLFWRDKEPEGQIIDAQKEARRLREASALGDAPNKTDVPVIERRERGWLEGIIN
jgi:hypothetical protein